MRIFIHIGSPKTGSSALQVALCGSEGFLKASNILYPISGREVSGGKSHIRQVGLRMAFEPVSSQPTGLMRSSGLSTTSDRIEYSKYFKSQLESEISRDDDVETIVFSDEALFIFANPEMVVNLAHYLGNIADEIQVICLLKRPSHFIAGSYSQEIKMGGSNSWNDFLEKRMRRPLYEESLKIWSDVFGKENLVVRPLYTDIISEFGSIVGYSALKSNDRRRNASLSSVGLQLLRYSNGRYIEEGKPRPQKLRRIFETAATLAPPWQPPANDCERIENWFIAERERLFSFLDFQNEDIDHMRNWPNNIQARVEHDQELPEQVIKEIGDIILTAMNK